MTIRLVQDRLDGYPCRTSLEEEQALREISQEIVIASLGRTDFFQKAAFQGGTCLRMFHGLERFSEDLDFALQDHQPGLSFVLRPYLDAIARDLNAFGYDLEIDDRSHVDRAVRTAFLKDDSIGKLLRLNYRSNSGTMRKVRIRMEVDSRPPAGAGLEVKYLDFPFVSAVTVYDLPSLFAGKIHALLCRPYVKGRDWYDFIWYTARRTPIHFTFLSEALKQLGPWEGRTLPVDVDWCRGQLQERIGQINWLDARNDVQRFLKSGEQASLDLWSRELFLSQCQKLV